MAVRSRVVLPAPVTVNSGLGLLPEAGSAEVPVCISSEEPRTKAELPVPKGKVESQWDCINVTRGQLRPAILFDFGGIGVLDDRFLSLIEKVQTGKTVGGKKTEMRLRASQTAR